MLQKQKLPKKQLKEQKYTDNCIMIMEATYNCHNEIIWMMAIFVCSKYILPCPCSACESRRRLFTDNSSAGTLTFSFPKCKKIFSLRLSVSAAKFFCLLSGASLSESHCASQTGALNSNKNSKPKNPNSPTFSISTLNIQAISPEAKSLSLKGRVPYALPRFLSLMKK